MEHKTPEFRERVDGFRRMLERALAARTSDSPEQHAQLFDRAREALVRHLSTTGLDPEDPSVVEQILALEDAIAEITGEVGDDGKGEARVAVDREAADVGGDGEGLGSSTRPADGVVGRDAGSTGLTPPAPGGTTGAEDPAVGVRSRPSTATRTPREPGDGREPVPAAATTAVRHEPEEPPGLFDGAVEVADDTLPVPPAEKLRVSRTTLAGALVASLAAGGLWVAFDPRPAVTGGRLDETAREIATESAALRALAETGHDLDGEIGALPPPTLVPGDGAGPALIGRRQRSGGDGSERIAVSFPSYGLALGFEIGVDRATDGTLRDIIRVDVEETPEPILHVGAPSLLLPGDVRARPLDAMPVRLGLRRLVVGVMDPLAPLLRERGAQWMILEFPVRMESGVRTTVAVPFETELFTHR